MKTKRRIVLACIFIMAVSGLISLAMAQSGRDLQRLDDETISNSAHIATLESRFNSLDAKVMDVRISVGKMESDESVNRVLLIGIFAALSGMLAKDFFSGDKKGNEN